MPKMPPKFLYRAYLAAIRRVFLSPPPATPEGETAYLERERTADRAVDLVVLTGERRPTVGPWPAHDLDALVEHLKSDAGGREAVSVRASKAVMISADLDSQRSLA